MTTPNQKYRPVNIVLGLITLSLTLVYTIGLWHDWPTWVHGSNWVWARQMPQWSGEQLSLLLLLVVMWVILLSWSLRETQTWSRGKTSVFLLSLTVFTPLIQLAIISQHRPQPLAAAFMTTTAPTAGFFHEGVGIESPRIFFQQHLDKMPGYRGVHMKTQPPGWPLAFWATWQAWEQFPSLAQTIGQRLRRFDCLSPDLQGYTPAQIAAATLQIAIQLLSGLGLWPLYKLIKALYSPNAARLSGLAYPVLPGILTFQTRIDIVYTIFALWVLWKTYQFVVHKRWQNAWALALAFTAISLFGFGPLVILVWSNIFLVCLIFSQSRPWNEFPGLLIRFNSPVAGLFIIFWGGIWIFERVSWWQMFQTSRNLHHLLRINYPLWPLFNLYDVAVFMGIPLFIYAVFGGLVTSFRLLRGPFKKSDAYVLSWLIILLLLNLSGEVRAETGRLWLFVIIPGSVLGVTTMMSCFGAAQNNGDGHPFRSRLLIAGMLSLLTFQGVITGSLLRGREIFPSTPLQQDQLPNTATPTNYRLGENITLEGYQITEKEDQILVTIFWRALTWVEADYSVFVHLEDENGLFAQSDSAPMAGQLPTWCWVPDEIVVDTHTLPQPTNPWHVSIGLYDWRTGDRLPVTPEKPYHAIPLFPP